MFRWIKRLFARKPVPEGYGRNIAGHIVPKVDNPWRGEMPVFKGPPITMAPPVPYTPNPNWADPAPAPRPLYNPTRPRVGGAPSLRRADDDRRTTFSPAPQSDPFTDPLSPLNPISPLYAASEPSYAPPPADTYSCPAPAQDYSPSPSIDFGSSSGGCDTSGGGW